MTSMRRIRFIGPPHEVLGAVRHAGDVLLVGDDTAADLLRRPWMFEEVVEAEPMSPKRPKRTADPPHE